MKIENIFTFIFVGCSILATGHSASACRMDSPTVLDDIKHADVVVVGQFVEYEFVVDEAATKLLKANPPASHIGPLIRYSHVRIRIEVAEVLIGKVPDFLEVIVTGSTSVSPKLSMVNLSPKSSYIFALIGADGPREWFYRKNFETTSGDQSLAVMQKPCSRPYIFDDSDEQIENARLILQSKRE